MAAMAGDWAQAHQAIAQGVTSEMQTAFTTDVDRRIAEAIHRFKGDEAFNQIQARITDLESRMQSVIIDGQKLLDNMTTQSADFLATHGELTNKLAAEFTRLDDGLASSKATAERVETMRREMEELLKLQSEAIQNVAMAAKGDIHKLQSNVREYVAEQVNTNGGSGGGDGRGVKLNNPRDSSIESIPENITRAQFQLWRENLCLHLESFKEFTSGIGSLLRKVRLGGHEKVTRDTIASYAHAVNEEALANNHGV